MLPRTIIQAHEALPPRTLQESRINRAQFVCAATQGIEATLPDSHDEKQKPADLEALQLRLVDLEQGQRRILAQLASLTEKLQPGSEGSTNAPRHHMLVSPTSGTRRDFEAGTEPDEKTGSSGTFTQEPGLREKPDSLYAYCVEQLVVPRSHLEAAKNMVLLSLVVTIQVILCFGFWDASWLMVYQGNTNLLGGAISEASFYPTHSITDAATHYRGG